MPVLRASGTRSRLIAADARPAIVSRTIVTRRALCAALIGTTVSAGIGCASAGSPAPTGAPSGAVGGIGPTVLPTVVTSPVNGRLIIVRDGNLVAFDLGGLKTTPVSSFPKGAYAASPRVSHDRQSLVFTYYQVPKDPKDLGGSDLYLSDATGANSRLLRAHPEAGATYEDPCWSADGKSVLATVRKPIYNSQNQYQGETLAIVRASVDGSEPTAVVKDALGPATSPDGKYLVYTTLDSKGQPMGLVIADAAGQSARELVPGTSFSYARAPVFSPDGTRIAFAAVDAAGVNPTTKRFGAFSAPFGSIAEAHGIPWDIWTVKPDGSDLFRLTHESEDTPTPTWSPHGDWVAFSGEIGLYLVDAAGKSTVRVSTLVSGGGITWLS